MPPRSAKATAKTKKTTRRRKKAVAAPSTPKTEHSGARGADNARSASGTTQIDVNDLARSAGDPVKRATALSSKRKTGGATARPKRKTTRRRTKKKTAVRPVEPAAHTDGIEVSDGEASDVRESSPTPPAHPANAMTTGNTSGRSGASAEVQPPDTEGSDQGPEPRRRTRRGRRGRRRATAHVRSSDDAATGLDDRETPPPDSAPGADDGPSSGATLATQTVPTAGEDSATTRSPDRSRDRARRRRGQRAARSSGSPTSAPPPTAAATPPSVAVSADAERDDALFEESEEGVEVDERTFPRPNLKEHCKREMVINVTGTDECRIAVLHEGRLEELFIERASSQSHVGNIYKGRITNVESSIQAAFVDFGLTKNGFLHISDVQPQYFPNRATETEEVGRKIPRHHRPPIQKCFRRGQEVMVQIIKEGVGTKGPTLTTYLSIPGRYLVMMPGMTRHGVSRKIEDEDARRKMKDVMNELTFPPGMGFILRTAGLGQTKRELQRDLNYMVRLWKRVVERVKRLPSPAELNRESDLVTRTIRDVYSTDFERLILDDAASAKKAKDFFQIAMPRSKPRIEVYTDPEPMFHTLGIEEEIERINARQVPLPCGGSLVIDSTEALVAIDVNSGRFRVPDNPEETALRVNLEAAAEIARQLRLRDLGGLIVCDFIDLRLDRNKRTVERRLRDALKDHKERARILRMSAFGLIEMTRQRQGPSLKRNIYFDCPQCRGSGLVKMPESVILDVMRTIQLAAYHHDVRRIAITASTDVAYQILNIKRTAISAIESATGKRVSVHGDLSFTSDQVECVCQDDRGQPIIIGGVRTPRDPRWSGAPR